MRVATLFALTLLLGAGSALARGEKVEICHLTGSEKNPAVTLVVSLSALVAHLAHGDSLGACDCGGVLPADVVACGGIAGIPCPAGTTCVDDPRDDCDPDPGGADCIGICVMPFADPGPETCPAGFIEVDDETDDCNPDCGDLDCRTLCVATNGATCEGFAGFTCDDPAFPDCGETLDGCHVDCGGADCGGTCVNLAVFPQVPCDEGDCCPAGSVCIGGQCWVPVLGGGGGGGGGGDDDDGDRDI